MADSIPPEKRRYLPKSYVPQTPKLNDLVKRLPPKKKYTKKDTKPKILKHLCGHDVNINLLQTSNCKDCDKKFKKERRDRNFKKKQELTKEGIKGSGSGWKMKAAQQLNTLPDESIFLDIMKRNGLWSGILNVPYIDEDGENVSITFSVVPSKSLYKLEASLNEQYVVWAKENAMEVPKIEVEKQK